MDQTDMTTGWVGEVLRFWFEELEPKNWFVRSDAVDAACVDRFSGVYAQVREMAVNDLTVNAATALAAVIVLDQFPRNMFRESAHAFATDAKALQVAKAAVLHGLDQQRPQNERIFFYIPFEHSEDLDDQNRCVELVTSLGDEEFLRYAELHRDVIKKFGRFPHRNGVLGRESTREELAFLEEKGRGF